MTTQPPESIVPAAVDSDAIGPDAIGPDAIDVALPYYGDVALMKQAVRSVLGQYHRNWRLLVVDDGYPDPEPARWFATLDDERVSYSRNASNLGANGNYRRCLSLVSAAVTVLMGADDVMQPNYLEVVADCFAAHPEAAVVQTGVVVIDEHHRAVRPLGDRMKNIYAPSATTRKELGGESLAVSLLRGNWTYFPSLAWRTSTLTRIGFREGLHVTQDLALLLDTVRDGGSMVFDPTLAFLYRRHSASDSSVKALDGRRFDEERKLFEAEAEAFEAIGWNKAAKAARWHVSSRLNALSLLPTAARTGSAKAIPKLAKHIVG